MTTFILRGWKDPANNSGYSVKFPCMVEKAFDAQINGYYMVKVPVIINNKTEYRDMSLWWFKYEEIVNG